MKNISRRVFIKGMAVAAVATAASTVLTGCKLPSGVTEDDVEVVVSSQTVTLKDTTAKVDVDVTVKGYETVANVDNMIAVPVTVVNESTATTTDFEMIAKSAITGYDDGNYYFGYAAYFDDNTTAVTAETIALASNIAGKDIPTKSAITNASLDGKLYFSTASHKDWKKLTIIFTVVEGNGTAVTSNTDLKQGYVVINR